MKFCYYFIMSVLIKILKGIVVFIAGFTLETAFFYLAVVLLYKNFLPIPTDSIFILVSYFILIPATISCVLFYLIWKKRLKEKNLLIIGMTGIMLGTIFIFFVFGEVLGDFEELLDLFIGIILSGQLF